MVVPGLMSLWLGWMLRVGVKHDRYYCMPDDPVKLGVVLGWVVNTGMLARFREMRSREKKLSLREFKKSEPRQRWVLADRATPSTFKIDGDGWTTEMYDNEERRRRGPF
jgi:hypothetical protein